jgi:hypothetical protein
MDVYASAELSELRIGSARVELSVHSTAHLRVTKSVVISIQQHGALNLEENVRNEEIAGAGSIDYFSIFMSDKTAETHGPSVNERFT